MQQHITDFLREEEGATAIEYGLIAGLVAVGIIVALTALGTDLSGLFTRISTKLKSAT
ncbi:Flp family type IVb pilin [Pigmentiphaga litoralis]|uniref:Flp family type IVb pilin n=1 Tax=Pigmentiphaga litoralis TaxID=516702 RepID=UPI003B436C38